MDRDIRELRARPRMKKWNLGVRAHQVLFFSTAATCQSAVPPPPPDGDGGVDERLCFYE
jgi:hypothetical protein